MKQILYFSLIMFAVACNKPAENTNRTSDSIQTQSDKVTDSNMLQQEIANIDFPLVDGKREIAMPIAYIWHYKYTPKNPHEEIIEYELWAYYEPQSKSWGFLPDYQFGASGSMYDYILCQSNGTYLFQSAEEHQVSTLDTYHINWVNEATLPDYYKASGKKREFNVDLTNDQPIVGKEYRVAYMQMKGYTDYYLADSEIDLTPLYQFMELARLNIIQETTLPISFPNDLPGNKLLLHSFSESSNPSATTEITLSSITPTATYFYLLPQ